MNKERYRELDMNPEIPFTEEEIKAGWHRCPDWDFMVVGPSSPELIGCLCNRRTKHHEN